MWWPGIRAGTEKTFLQEKVVKLPAFFCSLLLCSIDCTETEIFISSSLNNPLHFSDHVTTLWAAPELLSSHPKRLQVGDGHGMRGSRQDTVEIFFLHDVPVAFDFLSFPHFIVATRSSAQKKCFMAFPLDCPLSVPRCLLDKLLPEVTAASWLVSQHLWAQAAVWPRRPP